MRKTFAETKRWRCAAGTAVLAISMAGAFAPKADANGLPAMRSGYGATLKGLQHRNLRQHTSKLAFTHRDQFPQTKHVVLGRNKSMLIEVPYTLRDVIVSDPEIVDAVVQTSNRVYLIGKKIGQANAFFFDEQGEQLVTLEIGVEIDTKPLDLLIARLIPGSNVTVEALNDTLILTGSVRNPIDSNRVSELAQRYAQTKNNAEDDARSPLKVINMLAVEGEEQVMLRVFVAEVQRSLLKQFGINVAGTLNAGNFATSLLTQNALPLTAGAGLGGLAQPGIITGESTPTFFDGVSDGVLNNNGLIGSWASGGNSVAKALRALERTGLVRSLAEPNLTTVSGETAKFLAGGEFPVPIVDGDGGLGVTFKEFGIGLSFTPNVLSEGRISLKIDTEVSDLSSDGAVTLSSIAIPALNKRQAQTVVELPSGGSLAMAGLVSEDTRQNIDGFPGLKDVPVIGTLFRSRDFIKSETELVIIVTPYVVRPTALKNLAKPGDGMVPATDRRATFLGHLNRIYGNGTPLEDGGLKGDYGFIIE